MNAIDVIKLKDALAEGICSAFILKTKANPNQQLPDFEQARDYNDLFAFWALEVTGGYRHPSGLSFLKIEGRMYHQDHSNDHSLDAPGQNFTPRVGEVQFVNRKRLKIDDGEERRNIPMRKWLEVVIIDDITNHLSTCNPYKPFQVIE